MRRDAALLFAAQLFYKLTGFAFTVAVARLVAPGDLGAYFFVVALASTFVTAASLGISPLVMRRVAQDPAGAPRQIAASLAFRLALLPPFVALVVAVGQLARAGDVWLCVAAALIVGLEDVYFTLASIFFGLRRPGLNVSIGVPLQTVFTVAAPLILWWQGGGLWTLVAVQAGRSLLLVVVAWVVAARRIGGGRPRWLRGYADGTLPFATSGLVTSLAEQVETVVLGVLAADAALAAFLLAGRALSAGSFVPSVAAAVLAPRVAAAGLDGTRAAVRRAFLLVTLCAVAGAAVLVAIPGVVGGVLFGPMGPAVAPILRIMAILLPLGFAQQLLASLLQAASRERAVVVMAALSGVVGLLTGILLVPRLGAEGAAWARIASTFAQVVLGALALRAR